MGLLRAIRVRIMSFMVFFLIIILLPGLPPRSTFPFKEFIVKPPNELKGALEPNQHLEGAERLLDGRVYGPECLIVRNNEIYAGIHGGEVIKITSNHVTHVTKFGQPCEEIFEESRCGRPLGLAFDTKGNNLIVADAYYGLWMVDLTTHKKTLLVSAAQELAGKEIARPAKIFNSVAVSKQGEIYWTDSSSDFDIQNLVFTSFTNPSGRLFKYNRAENVSEVLLDELAFANGLALSPNEDFIVVAETGAARLTKYHLKGPNAGKHEVFVDGLPGIPDNLTPDDDGIWVPLPLTADSENPNAFAMFSRFPSIRLFFARMLSLFELPFRYISAIYPNKFTQPIVHFIGHGESIMLLAPKRATVLRVDWNGKIVGSLHGFDRSVGGISHVLEFQDHLYLGSPFNRYLGRVKSPKAAKPPTVKVRNVRVEGAGLEPAVKAPPPAATATKPTAAPTTTTARPTTTTTTTTTPKPTTTTTPRPTAAPTAARTADPTTTTPPTARPTVQPTPKATAVPATPKATAVPPPPQATAAPPTPKPAAATPPKPAATAPPRTVPQNPAPIKENIPGDTQPPKTEKLKVISQKGEHLEL
ncbi:adipocyte plasma membrane-associated protein [Scaptodrosophila lebanonensis]|uniref:Adipocyte plasma membrane-associated protein n=1 Tax=Drosophila lebanonensis TaxID=7225 RepID=A0A6J2T6H5_DROLE|nr:adipocyte plasma membrane-associated protein [Scaptodrosophila lebanonensis]